VPLVEATIEGNTIALSQRRFENFGAGLAPYTWHIPVALRVGMGGQSVERTVLLAQPEMKVEFEGAAPIDWVMPAADGVGYYRWSIGDERLKSLVAMAPKALNDKERVALMGNVGASLDGGLMGGDTYMQAIRSLAGDTEPFVIAAVLDELEKVEKTFVTAELEDAFAAYTGRTLSPLLDRYGIEPRTGENATIASFRPRLLLWMGALVGDESIVAWAEKTRKQYAKDPASLDPTLAGVSLRIAASDGDSELFDDFVKHFKAADNPAQRANYLAALGAFRDAAVRERALAFALEGPLRPNELFEIPGEIADRNDGADRAFQWMTENYDQVADRMPPLFRPYLTNFADGCDIERLQRAKAFFAEPAHHVDGTDRQLGKVEAAVRDCVSLREREGAKVKAYLHGTL
jgi:alanyl aminopeptidase